jgi:hypothetical protein
MGFGLVLYFQAQNALTVGTKIVGQALCCGQVPKHGYHNYHIWNGRPSRAFGFYCEICHKNSAVIGEDIPFALCHWNRKFQSCGVNEYRMEEPALNAPCGFRWGALAVYNLFVGGRQEKRYNIVLFKTSHEDLLGRKRDLEYIIDKDRYLKDVVLCDVMGGKQTDLSWLCKTRGASFYVHATWCTDNTAWYNVNLTLCNVARKHILRLREEALLLKDIK